MVEYEECSSDKRLSQHDMVKDECQVAGSMKDPLVCVSLDGCTVKEVIDEAARANLNGADMVEVRFDRLFLIAPETSEQEEGGNRDSRPLLPPESIWEKRSTSDIDVSEIIEELKGGVPLPVVFTCRSTSEGGFYPGDEDERCSILLEAINSEVSYIDLELSIEEKTRQKLLDAASDSGAKVIASIHGDGIPPVEDIVKLVSDSSDKGNTIKMCWTTDSQQESLKLVEASWEMKGEGHDFTIMGLGPGGDWTRIHAPVLDQSLVYATLQDDFHLGDRGLVNIKDLRNAWILLEY
jgi:3-dehydroquinate dehydratase type I